MDRVLNDRCSNAFVLLSDLLLLGNIKLVSPVFLCQIIIIILFINVII